MNEEMRRDLNKQFANVPLVQPPKIPDPRWRADALAAAVKMFNGAPPKPIIDTSPNRGAGWMTKR